MGNRAGNDCHRVRTRSDYLKRGNARGPVRHRLVVFEDDDFEVSRFNGPSWLVTSLQRSLSRVRKLINARG